MVLTSVLEKLTAAGLKIEAVDGRLKVTPASRLTLEITDTIKAHKAEIVDLLSREREQPGDVLTGIERQRLMDACADECRASHRGQEPDWLAVDRINERIGEAFTRRDLMPLLDQYKAELCAAKVTT